MKFKVVKEGMVLAKDIETLDEARKVQEKMALTFGQGNLITIAIQQEA